MPSNCNHNLLLPEKRFLLLSFTENECVKDIGVDLDEAAIEEDWEDSVSSDIML